MSPTKHTAPSQAPKHRPVLLAEVMRLLAPRDGGIYVDGTYGAGGYSHAILESADCRVWGIDRDPSLGSPWGADTQVCLTPPHG